MIYTRHLVILFFLIFITSLPLKALNDKAIKARAEHITFNPSKVIFVASGNAKVNFQDIELSGGTICVDIASSRLVASGNVSLTSEMGEINCDSISINLHSKKCYILASESVEPRVEFDVTTFQIVSSLKDFPGGAFSMDNIINSDLCITGNEIVVQPNETAQIRPAAFWINGSRSMELPFYSFTIGAGASYTTPRVAYTDMGATVDVPVIVSLEEKSMSLAHMKYNSNMGFSVTLEHQQRFSDNASAIFYLDDLNKDAYRKARMQYRHKFGSQTDATLNVDWQNNKDVDVFLNMSHRFSKSNLTFNFRSQYAVSKPEGTPASFELYWRQNPDNFLG
ncbi:MAG TPA: hypothetical protein PL110_18635, partial [Candidatus Eremiobacteraeota bacterium]|nr:hypothetical protein [Candidatus Eremiobacteraeota bacterium]